jgi:hypothetical protein
MRSKSGSGKSGKRWEGDEDWIGTRVIKRWSVRSKSGSGKSGKRRENGGEDSIGTRVIKRWRNLPSR